MSRVRRWLSRPHRVFAQPDRWVPEGRPRIVVAVMAALVLAGAVAQVADARRDQLPDDAAFRMGDTVVTEQQLSDRIDLLTALYGIERPDDPDAAQAFERDAAKSYAVSIILRRAGADEDIVIADKQARDLLTKVAQRQFANGYDGLSAMLDDRGVSELDVLDEIELQLVTAALFENVTADVAEVSAEEVRRAFEERRESMVAPEQRRIRNIVLKTRAQAAAAVRALRDGRADFTELAATISLDASTRDSGGLLGTVSKEELEPDFAEIAFAVGAGEVFGPVRSQYGWNVGLVEEIVEAMPLRFEAVKERLARDLEDERRLAEWRDWLAERIAEADVEYAPAYRPSDPDAPPSLSTPLPSEEGEKP